MGHTMDAALLATAVLVGGLRNARRRGVGLAERARLVRAERPPNMRAFGQCLALVVRRKQPLSAM
jgi:hypothetical protein